MSLPQPSAGGAPCLRRGALAAAALAFSVASLAACAAGTSAPTLQVKPDNAAATAGDIKIQNVNVITQPDGAEGPAVVAGKIFNNGTKDQTLESITVPGAGGNVRLFPAKGTGPLIVPAGGALILGGEGNAAAVIAKGSASARDGDAQRVVFDLSETGKVRLSAFVVPATSYFEGFGPTAVPTPSRTGTPHSTPTGGTAGEEGAVNGDRDDTSRQAHPSESAAGHGAGH
ncbi:DUF461 domain-containing protein [Streptomyces sp. KR80]|uniref:DUF461 domain-containing protein n=1 Tax=Streptomyces sp. KR80 TaxID=3457426 RepID=UPI003FD6B2FA